MEEFYIGVDNVLEHLISLCLSDSVSLFDYCSVRVIGVSVADGPDSSNIPVQVDPEN